MCQRNAIRLLEDAKALFEKNSYLTAFFLSQLSLEELAKGFKLIEKHATKQPLLDKEWKKFTASREAHVSKLKYLQEVEDEWTDDVTKEVLNRSYLQVLQEIIGQIQWANTLDEYRERFSKAHYKWRIKSLYVDFDWKRRCWLDPASCEILPGIFIDETHCQYNIQRASHLSSVLQYRISEKR